MGNYKLFVSKSVCAECGQQTMIAQHHMVNNNPSILGLVCLNCGNERLLDSKMPFGFYTGKNCVERVFSLPSQYNEKAIGIIMGNKRFSVSKLKSKAAMTNDFSDDRYIEDNWKAKSESSFRTNSHYLAGSKSGQSNSKNQNYGAFILNYLTASPKRLLILAFVVIALFSFKNLNPLIMLIAAILFVVIAFPKLRNSNLRLFSGSPKRIRKTSSARGSKLKGQYHVLVLSLPLLLVGYEYAMNWSGMGNKLMGLLFIVGGIIMTKKILI